MSASPNRLQVALDAARAAGEILLDAFGSRDFEIESKEAHDFVTTADRESERAILALISSRCPGDQVLSEEKGWVGGDSRHQWIIDPLDGTTNFLQGLPVFGISLACRRGSETILGVVFDPIMGSMYCAERGAGAECNGTNLRVSGRPGLDGAFLATGFPFKARGALDLYLDLFGRVFLDAGAIRRCGAAVLDLARTASGVYDGFFEFRLAPWDLAAGALLVEEAGGRVSDLDGGQRYLETGNLVAGSPAVYRDLLKTIASVADEAALDLAVPSSTQGAGLAC